MAIYVYNLSDGSLFSYCPNDTDPVASPERLALNGLAAVSGLPQLSPTVAWNPATHTTRTVTPPVIVPAPPISGTIVFNGVTYVITGSTS